jgi:hypothetical protein
LSSAAAGLHRDAPPSSCSASSAWPAPVDGVLEDPSSRRARQRRPGGSLLASRSRTAAWRSPPRVALADGGLEEFPSSSAVGLLFLVAPPRACQREQALHRNARPLRSAVQTWVTAIDSPSWMHGLAELRRLVVRWYDAVLLVCVVGKRIVWLRGGDKVKEDKDKCKWSGSYMGMMQFARTVTRCTKRHCVRR